MGDVNMGAEALPVALVTAFWAIVGIILPFFLGKGPNKGVIQVVLVITAVTCWLFWLLCYMHQMNPLIGPEFHNTTILALQYVWEKTIDIVDVTHAPETTMATTAASF